MSARRVSTFTSAGSAERTAISFETARFIQRNIPNFEILNEEALQIIEWNAETVLEEIGHGGMAGGINFEFRYFPGQDLTLVVFCNQDNGAFDDLRKNATRLITGER